MLNLIKEYLPNVYNFGWTGDYGWGTAIWQTIYMTFWSGLIGGIMGLVAGVTLVITDENGFAKNKPVFFILDKIVSLFRAIPFIIMLVIALPISRNVFHAGIGPNGALLPLALSLFPFYARQVQAALAEISPGLIEAGLAAGGNFWDLIGIYLKESRSELIRVSTVSIISLIGLTAMAGAIGSGGIGNMAVVLGYQRYYWDVMWLGTFIILLMIFIVQFIGDTLAKRLNHQ
ncbi:MAG: ABC transporter permease [Lactobacillaceae bacterium]|jgi:D-methionine transport system permease protein|nr:ABC transporter permease [Lactobacillaceae bacterium]